LEAGVPTKTHVLNLLHRLLDGKPTDQPDVNPPAALTLSKEPEANVAWLMMGYAPREEHAMRHDPAGAASILGRVVSSPYFKKASPRLSC